MKRVNIQYVGESKTHVQYVGESKRNVHLHLGNSQRHARVSEKIIQVYPKGTWMNRK